MRTLVFADADTAAMEAATIIAGEARAAVATRGCFIMGVSGGTTPRAMFRAFAGEDVPWEDVHIVQMDERIAPDGDPDRNLTALSASLISHVPLPPDHIHAMPVGASDLEAATARYANTLQRIAGSPPILDLAHLGLGRDGHTASLVPDDPALNVADRDVALTGVYEKRRRMTLTYPIINRSRHILWLVTGPEKGEMLSRLLSADHSIPAGRIRQTAALALVDRPAAGIGETGTKTDPSVSLDWG